MHRTVRPFSLFAVLVPALLLLGCSDRAADPVSPSLETAAVSPDTAAVAALVVPGLNLLPGEVAFQLPQIDAAVEAVDLCELIPGLCGENCLQDDPSQLGPSKDRKGFGFKLDGCTNITELRLVSGNLAFGGDLAVSAGVTPGSLGADPGCREVTVTIPGRPAIPAIPPIRNPLTGEILIPGRPGRPAIPPGTVTHRIPAGCSPLRPPSVDIEWPALNGLSFRTAHRVAGTLVIEAAGSGEVDLRFPIPKVSKSVTAIGQTDDRPDGEQLRYRVGAGVGLYGVIRGRLTEGGVRLDLTIDESYETDQLWSPTTGWTGTTAPVSTEMASETRFAVPDTLEIAYGVQPAIGLYVEPWPRAELGVLPAQPGYAVDFGLWTLRYFDNVFSANERGNLKNDAGAGLEAGIYGGIEYLGAGEEASCDAENLSACDWADFYREIDCCEADLYDQYGIGLFEFETTTSGGELDLDPDGYTVTWARTGTTPEPWVDSVMVQHLPTTGTAFFPDGDLSGGDAFATVFGLVRDTHCAEYYSDAPIVLLSPGAGVVVPELRRRGWNIPLYSKIVGCHQVPADYGLTVSGLAMNCTLDGSNPRTVALQPNLNVGDLELPPSEREGISRSTEVPIDVHCRPLVGDVRVASATFGEDHDSDGYSLAADDEVKGLVEGRVAATGAALLEELRVGAHTLTIGDVAFNCVLRGHPNRPVTVAFEAVTDVTVQADCESVYAALCAEVDAMVGDGSIRSPGIGRSLCARLEAAERARDRGNVRAVQGPLQGLENQVRALAGRQITGDAAQRLLGHLDYIRASNYFMP